MDVPTVRWSRFAIMSPGNLVIVISPLKHLQILPGMHPSPRMQCMAAGGRLAF